MPASPICEVKDGLGPWTPTADGVNVTPGGTVSIRLADATDVVEWYLRIFGTDEETPTPPTLTNVNPLTNKVTTPSTTVTFAVNVTLGHALLFESVIVTATQTIPTTFGVYELAANGLRVGAVGETREGSVDFGWAKTYNEAIRSIGSGFTAGGDLSGSSTSQTVVGLQGRTLATTAPATGDVLKWSGAQWEPGIGGGSITLGGDLADWTPTPGDDQQRVIGLNMVPIPEPEPPVHGDMLRAEAPLLLSNSPFDITSDSTRVWVGDIFNPLHPDGGGSPPAYGGLVGVTFAEDFIDTRHDYPSGTVEGTPYDSMQIWSVVHLDGYIYATALLWYFYVEWFESIPVLLKIDPVTGLIVTGSPIHGMSYVRTDGTLLYLLEPHPGKFLPGFFWVGPSDLTTQTAIGGDHNPGAVGFAHDTTLGKVWLASGSDGDVMRVDATTHAVDFTVSYDTPSGMAYSPGKVWLLVGSMPYYNYTPGYQYDYYGDTTDLLVLDPATGATLQAVTDPDGLILGALRMAYDSVNNKIWVLCDETDPCVGSPAVCYGPRLVRVDATTMTVDGWASLDVAFNMAVTVAGGYVWVVDSPAGDPSGGAYTILKIDPSIVVYPAAGEVAPGIIARITSGALSYYFTKKNQDFIIASSEDPVYVTTSQEVVLVEEDSTVRLPGTPVDGERHTIRDNSGYAGQYGPIYVRTFNGAILVATIATNGGSVTVIWSSSLGYWSVI